MKDKLGKAEFNMISNLETMEDKIDDNYTKFCLFQNPKAATITHFKQKPKEKICEQLSTFLRNCDTLKSIPVIDVNDYVSILNTIKFSKDRNSFSSLIHSLILKSFDSNEAFHDLVKAQIHDQEKMLHE